MKHPAPRFLTTLFLFSLCQVLPPTQAQTFATPPPSHTATQTHPLTTTPSGTPNLDSEEWAFLTLINNYRAQNGLSALQVDVDLENSAQWMSNDMASNNYFSHTDSLGRSPGARLAAFGYTYYPWGENLAAGFSDAQDAFNGWLNACDPDASGNCTYAHRANMLGSGYNAIGIARAYGAGSTYGWYWTTDFGGVVEQAINPPGSPTPTPTPTPTPSAPSIASFTASPATVAAGQTATLSWSTSGATSVTIDNGIGAVAASGSVTVTPSQTTTYTLTASNSSYFTTAKATVTVSAPTPTPPPTPTPSIASFNASPATVAAGQTATLSWSTSGATSVTIDNGVGAVAASGSVTVTPSQTTTYTLTASNSTYFTTAKATVTVSAGSTPQPSTCPAPASGAFTGCYYSNLTLSGNPVMVRTDPQINFNWGYAPPSRAIPAGPYSVQWQGNFTFAAGTYTFTATTSDGMRIYIDGNLVLDRWFDQPAYIYNVRSTLAAGVHLIVVQYYDNTGSGTAHLTWQNNTPATQPPSILSFTASPAAVAAGQKATLSWSVNGATDIAIDNGVGDVTGAASAAVQPGQTTTYTLTASNSAGSATAQVTVTVASQTDTQPPTAPVLTSAVARSATEVDLAWSAATDNVGVSGYRILRNGSVLASVSGSTLTYADQSAAANTTYTYAVVAFDGAGNTSAPSNPIQVTTPASAPTGGACPPPAAGTFTACYYSGTALSGNPVLTETDNQINFDWGAGSPAPSVPASNFSARWQGYFNFDSAVYSFVAQVSDGIRVYIDGQLLIDHWQDQPVTFYQARPAISQGSHLITVEYYAHSGWASCHLTWQER